MKWIFGVAAMAACANLWASASPLASPCVLTVGAVVGTHPTLEVAALLEAAPTTDEFQTSEQHAANVKAFLATLPAQVQGGQLCVSPIADQKLFDYDADAQVLWANVEEASGTRIFRSTVGRITVRDVVSDEWDQVVDDRVLTNAMGVQVAGINSTSKSASVGFTTDQMNDLHKSLPYHRFKSAFPSRALSIPIESDAARDVKPHAAIVYQYRLRDPFVARGTDVHAATIDAPVSIAVEKVVVLADLVAVGVIDGRDGKVLAVKPMSVSVK
ncbi:hypothetical protein ACNPM2_03755 [Stenotrophomonas geniculata]|uniref:hypothetical protein n=1 Tax=Stenotrophomonas TaxID=40323 RepID=UPI00177CC966|nr:hypothetical protein [Stenotrophomonas sp. AS012628]